MTPENNVVCRHSTQPVNRPVVKVTASLENADSYKTVKISSSNTGGIVKFGTENNNATNDSLTLTIPKTGSKDFYISGEKESTKTKDVTIIASTNDNPTQIVGSKNVTVLWVTLIFNDTTISKNNGLRERFRAACKDGNEMKDKLGVRILQMPGVTKSFLGYAYEIKGDVKPNDFVSDINLQRVADAFLKIKAQNAPNALVTKIQSFNKDDTSYSENLVKKPTPIWDIDQPGMDVDDLKQKPINYTAQQICNMMEYAVYDDNFCSDIMCFSILIYCVIENNNIKDKGGDSKQKHRPVEKNAKGQYESIHWKF
ncbi:MAG: hypothetical protein LBE18_11055 [Planctomycetaceae bacterium]|nr:hypothetical protein [Planctomycetaceae bacterium]